jgi:Zn finger protein HypA/HybF involved in hydrogenase expression
MTPAKERARQLAAEVQQAIRDAKAAERRVKELGDALMSALAEAKAEAEAERMIVEYPPGRYECKGCRQGVLFTEPKRVLTPCENCGSTEIIGAEPTVTRLEPPPPKQYPAGMYACIGCGTRVVLAADMDELSPCEMCGIVGVRPV